MSEEEWEDDEDWEEESWEDDEGDEASVGEEAGADSTARAAGDWSTRGPADGGPGRGLALGFLAMLPLFAAYELALRSVEAGAVVSRNKAELLCFLAFRPWPAQDALLRVAVLGAAAVAAGVACWRRRVAVGPGGARIVLEGLAGAVLFGPAMALAMAGLRAWFGPIRVRPGAPEDPVELAEAGFVFGGAAYEELVFRVLLYGLCFLAVRHALRFLGVGTRGSGLGADAAAVLVSSLAFAAFHLRAFSAWLGPGGEEFQPVVFTWRFMAGILLALLFRWRGPGVAAWTHGLFNVAVVIGAGPEVLL